MEAREAELLAHFTEELRRVDGLRIIGEAPEKAAVVSFLIDGAHAHDLATLLDLEGVAVRSGQHCAPAAAVLRRRGYLPRLAGLL